MNESRADGVRVAYPLFQVEGSGAIPTSALQLSVAGIDWTDARKMNRLWHSRLPVMRSACPPLCFGAEFDGVWYAVAMWTNPVARALPQQTWLELRRFAIAPDAPKNTGSRMLAVMAKLIRRHRPTITTLVSYQDTEVHTGCIYRAAGWTATRLSDGDDWTGRKGRENRKPSQSVAPKQRWEKSINDGT